MGTTVKDVSPKDIRKGISEALDMMPFSNRTAFELEIERLRKEAENDTSLQGYPGWIQNVNTGTSRTYVGSHPRPVGDNVRGSVPQKFIENKQSMAYSDGPGQPPLSHRGRPSIFVGYNKEDNGATTNEAEVPSQSTEAIPMAQKDSNSSQTSPYGFIVLPGGHVKHSSPGVVVHPVGKPQTAGFYGYDLPSFPPPKHYHPHFHFPTKVSHKVVPVPFPVVRVQPVYYPIYRQVPVPKPYPVVHERHIPVPQYIPVPKPIPQPIYVPLPKPIPQPVPVPQPIPVPKPVPYPVPRPYPVPVPLPEKDKSVIQLGLRIERPHGPPLRQKVFQFLTHAAAAAHSPPPPSPQAVPIPMSPMVGGYPSYGHFNGPIVGKGGYPIDMMAGGYGFSQGGPLTFSGLGMNQGGYGSAGGFGTSFNSQMSGGSISDGGMREMQGSEGTVEVNRRSETETEQRNNSPTRDELPQPFQENDVTQSNGQDHSASASQQEQPYKSSLMRFILNVDS